MQKIVIDQWFMGGLSDSKYVGIKNSLYSLVGCDLHTTPGLIRANYAMAKESGTTVDALVTTILPCSDGNTYLFNKTSGKIWKRTSAGSYSLVYTISATGPDGVLDACEYGGYIYFATATRLHRTLVSNPFNVVNVDWATFTVGNTSYHPMLVLNNVLYIGDGYLVAQVDNVTFSANALDIPTNETIRCLGKYLTDLLLGTYITSVVNIAKIYRWNTWSVSWTVEDTVEEAGINAFLKTDNYTVVSAGLNGNLYAFNGMVLQPMKHIPGTYTPTSQSTVYPNAVGMYLGIPIFGLSQQTGNPSSFGIYSIGALYQGYPKIISLDFPIVVGTAITLTDIEIGAIAVLGGNKILASWKSGATYGVSVLDATSRLNGAYFETRVMDISRDELSRFKGVYASYDEIPASTSISIQTSRNGASYVSETEVIDTDRKIVSVENTIEATTFQVKVIFNTNAENSTALQNIIIPVE